MNQAFFPQPQVPAWRGRYFSCALPPGWMVVQETSELLYICAPDESAGLVMLDCPAGGPWAGPEHFAQAQLHQPRWPWQRFGLGNAQRVPPLPGYGAAAWMDCAYVLPAPCGPRQMLGAVISQAGTQFGTVTLVAASADVWKAEAGALRQIAAQAAKLRTPAPAPVRRASLKDLFAAGKAVAAGLQWVETAMGGHAHGAQAQSWDFSGLADAPAVAAPVQDDFQVW